MSKAVASGLKGGLRLAAAWLAALLLILGHGLPPSFGDAQSSLFGPGDICTTGDAPADRPGHDHSDCALHCVSAFAAGPPATAPAIIAAWIVPPVPAPAEPGEAPRPAAPVSQHSPRGPPLPVPFA